MALRFSIVTPSFNQARFLEPAILSVLEQRGPEMEYLVMDGGSTDGSVEIIQRHAARLAYWKSASDAGQYDAVTEGFNKTTGDIMAWLNSDDLYTPWAFAVVAEIFEQLPQVQWLTTTTPIRWDSAGRAVRVMSIPGYSRDGFRSGEYLPAHNAFAQGFIQQESTFWRRNVWVMSGAQVGVGYPLAGDFELWARFFQHTELYAVETPLGGFRYYGDQKTGNQRDRYLAEAERAFLAHGGRRHPAWKRLLRQRGFLRQPAKIVRHNRHSGRWEPRTIYV